MRPLYLKKTMEILLAGIDGISCWLDDVCCTAPNQELHLIRLKEVLRRLSDAGLKLQREKCEFFKESVTYLGFVIDKTGVKSCPKKVQAILEAPCPKNIIEVKRFLGIVNYYRNFIPQALSVLAPLHELLRKDATWSWGKRQDYAIKLVKRNYHPNVF